MFRPSKSGHLEKPCRDRPRNNNPTLLYDGHGHSVGCSMRIYKQNERHLASVLLLNFPDFAFKDKAENAFFTPGISPPDSAKIAFFRHKTTLFVGFCFSDCKNNKFCRRRKCIRHGRLYIEKDVWLIKYFRPKSVRPRPKCQACLRQASEGRASGSP